MSDMDLELDMLEQDLVLIRQRDKRFEQPDLQQSAMSDSKKLNQQSYLVKLLLYFAELPLR